VLDLLASFSVEKLHYGYYFLSYVSQSSVI